MKQEIGSAASWLREKTSEGLKPYEIGIFVRSEAEVERRVMNRIWKKFTTQRDSFFMWHALVREIFYMRVVFHQHLNFLRILAHDFDSS